MQNLKQPRTESKLKVQEFMHTAQLQKNANVIKAVAEPEKIFNDDKKKY